MKKLLALIVAIVTAIVSLQAQNANRNGLFVEAGLGGLIGNSVRTSISIKDNVVQYKCLSGMAGDLGLGFRLRIKRHWAYEIKAEGTIPFQNPIHALIGRFLPLGFRYTSVELWKNYSLYGHFNVGGAVTVNSGREKDFDDIIYLNTVYDKKLKGYEGYEGWGASYSLGIGANITTHFYAEACWNGNILFNCYGKNGRGTLSSGMAAFVIGYRF